MAKDWREWIADNPDIVHGKPTNENPRVLNKDILDFDTEGSKIKTKKFMDKFNFDRVGAAYESFAEMADKGMLDDLSWMQTKSGMKNKWPIVDMAQDEWMAERFGQEPRVGKLIASNTNTRFEDLDILAMLDKMEENIQRDYEALPFLEKLKYNKDYYTSKYTEKLKPMLAPLAKVAKPVAAVAASPWVAAPLAAYGALEYFKGSPANEGEEEELRRMRNNYIYNKAYRGPLSD
tara:strand:- start:402 stop:1103 length:702 start_codon:yes stop_codon:yes gene_type:complete